MLFNSYQFIFFFLPTALIGFFVVGHKFGDKFAVLWLGAASMFFYGWWNPTYLGLIVSSVVFNYWVGLFLANEKEVSGRHILLVCGVTVNLTLLGVFKYANFVIENVNLLTGSNIYLDNIVLPLAISFFTFQQIAYLVDSYRGEVASKSFPEYCLFVTFFPQLIAGPIVQHKEMLPQFLKPDFFKFDRANLDIGLTIFAIGLFKKVILADSISGFADSAFDAAENGETLTLFEAWGGVLAYTFQLYFDFSGYADMAIGTARMFGIRLPLNFNSPYKAASIIEFWRRWHMTLSRFLRGYLYISLGGNRKGWKKRYLFLMITMLLGGLWHGANWTFVIWGGLHGVFLLVNHTWRAVSQKLHQDTESSSLLGHLVSVLLTFAAVSVAWTFFRAETVSGATQLIRGMFGFNGIALPHQLLDHFNKVGDVGESLQDWGVVFGAPKYFSYFGLPIILAKSFIIVWFLPNTRQLIVQVDPLKTETRGDRKTVLSVLLWRPNLAWAFLTFSLFGYSLLSLHNISEFLYFQF